MPRREAAFNALHVFASRYLGAVELCAKPPPSPPCGAPDCECACCVAEDCPTLTANRFRAGSAAGCTADACTSRYASCPNKAAQNAGSQVHATHVPIAACSPPLPSAPPPALPTPTKARLQGGDAAMPIWLQAVLGATCALLLGCCLFVLYIRKRERANKPIWTNLETMQVAPAPNVGSSSAP